ncbi:MAG: hypothetical protein U0524_00300 [Candidatus Saccharimonadales bacterium]
MKGIPKRFLSGRRNFVPGNRDGAVIRRHAPIVLKPTIMAIIGVVLWKLVFYNNHIGFAKEAENPLLLMVLPLVGFVYVIFASIAVGSVFDEYKTVSRAVVKKDLDTFLLHRDEQLPILIHILIAAPSLILVALAMLLHYESVYAGAAAVFSVIFVITTTWIVATELDDFENGIWFKENIPEEWHEVDIKEYFAAKTNK